MPKQESYSEQYNKFQISVKQFQSIMETKGEEAIAQINKLGGIEEICNKLETSANDGITGEKSDLELRRKIYGSNVLPPKPTKSFMRLVCEAMNDVTLIILIVVAIISIALSFYHPTDDTDANEETSSGWIEGIAILVSVAVVVLVTACNDYSKEKQFRALQNKIEEGHTFSVLRGGEIIQVQIGEIVVGDICCLRYGDALPVDGIIVQSNDLRIDEASFTGESDLVKKGTNVDPTLLSGTNVMEGSGKMIAVGVGLNSQVGIILKLLGAVEDEETKKKKKKKKKRKGKKRRLSQTSENADIGENQFEVNKGQSVLQMKLNKLAVQIGIGGLLVAFLVVAILILQFCIRTFGIQKKPWKNTYLSKFVEILLVGITIIVVAVPEGLPLAVTLALAYSVKKMIKDNNLVRHLGACETMGNATTICSDKTGTLTTNRMSVVQSYICEKLSKKIPNFNDIPPIVSNLIIEGISLNTSYVSNVEKEDFGKITQIGNKTECALLGFAMDLGQDYRKIREGTPEESFTHVYTFNSVRKSMSTVVPQPDGSYRLFTKGASEIILKKCGFIYLENGKLDTFTESMQRNLVSHVIEPMASDGLRTISIAYCDFIKSKNEINQKVIEGNIDWEDENGIISNLTCLCVLGIQDPIRPEVPEAIKKCKRAGIVVRMVTGDNINTARTIARQCGIIESPKDLILESKNFNKLIRNSTTGLFEQKHFDKIWPKLRVLARSSPTDKYVLVGGIIDSKVNPSREVVAVTGDGTNDGPALRKADVGFAMGITGTDVAKEASDIILTDDNFNSIVKAVLWGRNIYDSITKFLQFQLTINLIAVVTTVIAAFVVNNSPLRAVQMLWVNLVMDTLASLSLATESPTDELLLRKPYGRTKSLVSKSMILNIIAQSVYQLTVLFVILFIGDKLFGIESGNTSTFSSKPTQHYTIIFNVFIMMILFNEINARKVHGERNIFKGLFSNPVFYMIWIFTFVAQVIIVEFGSWAFSTTKLTLDQWLWCLFLGIGTIIWRQIYITFPMDKIFPEESNKDKPIRKGSFLWYRGYKRINVQLKVVKAFKTVKEEIDNIREKSRLSLSFSTEGNKNSMYPTRQSSHPNGQLSHPTVQLSHSNEQSRHPPELPNFPTGRSSHPTGQSNHSKEQLNHSTDHSSQAKRQLSHSSGQSSHLTVQPGQSSRFNEQPSHLIVQPNNVTIQSSYPIGQSNHPIKSGQSRHSNEQPSHSIGQSNNPIEQSTPLTEQSKHTSRQSSHSTGQLNHPVGQSSLPAGQSSHPN